MDVLQCKGETLCFNLVEWDIESGLQHSNFVSYIAATYNSAILLAIRENMIHGYATIYHFHCTLHSADLAEVHIWKVGSRGYHAHWVVVAEDHYRDRQLGEVDRCSSYLTEVVALHCSIHSLLGAEEESY